MITIYLIGVVIATLVALSIVIWEIVNEGIDILDTEELILISLLSWVSLFVMVMIVIFMKLRKNKEEE